MSKDDRYTPRIVFDVTEELKAKADELLGTHGIRKPILTLVLEDLLNLIEENGQFVVGALLERAIKPREVLPSLKEAERRSNG